MTRILAAFVALSFALPVAAAQPPQQALRPIDDVEQPDPADPAPTPTAPPFPGATVLVPPLISVNNDGGAQPVKVLRLPVEAGKVSKMVATNLLTNKKSWIAKGHRYYSLCMPDGSRVACAPIVATSTMKDIEVGAYADENGEPKLTFRIAPGTTQGAKPLIAAINYFLIRTSGQAAYLDRKAANSAPAKAGTPSGGIAPSLIGDSGAGGCGYDDLGGDCTGGDGGWNGDGYDADSYYWGNDYFGDEDSWDDPGTSDIPSFPSGTATGSDADPCMDAGGNNICQQVIITEVRPEPVQEMALPTCVATPWAVACTRAPPVVIDPTDQIPKGERPWLPQSACNAWGALCSAGQVPFEDPPPLTEEERRRAATMACYRHANAALTYCHDFKQFLGDRWFETCKANALAQGRECGTTGVDR